MKNLFGQNKIHLDREPPWTNKMIHIASFSSFSNLYGNLIINLSLRENFKKNQEFSTKLINYYNFK